MQEESRSGSVVLSKIYAGNEEEEEKKKPHLYFFILVSLFSFPAPAATPNLQQIFVLSLPGPANAAARAGRGFWEILSGI